MNNALIERLNLAIRESGKSARAISIAAGMSSEAIRGIFRHPDASVTISTIEKLAAALSVDPEWLAFGKGSADIASTALAAGKPRLTVLKIIGEVAAGLWMDPEGDRFDPLPYSVPSDPRFPDTEQYLLRVRGNSINRKAAAGSLVRCLGVYSAPREPRAGDWVIVERTSPDGAIETTVKRLETAADGSAELWPDSDDPRFQSPIRIGGQEGGEVKVVAFVIDFINPATRL